MERTIRDRLGEVLRRMGAAAMRAGRDPADVRLVVVTKNRAAEEIREVLAAGRYALGENRVQEALDKIPALPPDTEWHLIGHLQTNKVAQAIRQFALIHSVDSARLAEAIQRAADREDRFVDVLLEVNVSGEATKYGLRAEEVEPLLATIARTHDRLRVRGLMTMAALEAQPEATRPVFRGLRLLRDRLAAAGHKLPELSMGMTNDFEVAVEEGATMVRVGTAIFE